MYLHLLIIVGVLGSVAVLCLLVFIFIKLKIRSLDRISLFILISWFSLVFVRGITESGLLFIFSIRTLLVWAILGFLLGVSTRREKNR